ncbi:MAG: AbrB/MazE/SpoVT family DNA-binding domain-containing protein [Kiloniellaceae bacterium]
MPISTLTSKGQTTIPKDIRRHLGLKPGDRIRFLVETDGRVVVVPATLRVCDLRGSLPKPSSPVTVDRMRKAIRRRSAKR